jgi:hypothetical protein
MTPRLKLDGAEVEEGRDHGSRLAKGGVERLKKRDEQDHSAAAEITQGLERG